MTFIPHASSDLYTHLHLHLLNINQLGRMLYPQEIICLKDGLWGIHYVLCVKMKMSSLTHCSLNCDNVVRVCFASPSFYKWIKRCLSLSTLIYHYFFYCHLLEHLGSEKCSTKPRMKVVFSHSISVYFPPFSVKVQPWPPDVTQFVHLEEELRENEGLYFSKETKWKDQRRSSSIERSVAGEDRRRWIGKIKSFRFWRTRLKGWLQEEIKETKRNGFVTKWQLMQFMFKRRIYNLLLTSTYELMQ